MSTSSQRQEIGMIASEPVTDAPRDQEAFLGPLGIDLDEESVYRCLVHEPGLSANEITQRTGVTRKAASEALMRLQDLGLVTRVGGKKARFASVAPAVALEALASHRKTEIERAHMRGAQFFEELSRAPARKTLAEVITVVEGRSAMREHCRRLHDHAKREVLTFERGPYSSPAQSNAPGLDALGRGVSCRTIYEPQALEIEGHMAMLEEQIQAGEESRLLSDLPVWMIIVDGETALVPLNPAEHSESGAVLVHSSWLLDALVSLFNALWERAIPLNSQAVPEIQARDRMELTERDQAIVRMLSAGIKDEVIARQMGVNPATVRRRIKALSEMAGVESRFQLGATAVRKGWT